MEYFLSLFLNALSSPTHPLEIFTPCNVSCVSISVQPVLVFVFLVQANDKKKKKNRKQRKQDELDAYYSGLSDFLRGDDEDDDIHEADLLGVSPSLFVLFVLASTFAHLSISSTEENTIYASPLFPPRFPCSITLFGLVSKHFGDFFLDFTSVIYYIHFSCLDDRRS